MPFLQAVGKNFYWNIKNMLTLLAMYDTIHIVEEVDSKGGQNYVDTGSGRIPVSAQSDVSNSQEGDSYPVAE